MNISSLLVTFLQAWLNSHEKEDFTSGVSNEWASVNKACSQPASQPATTLETAAAALRCDELYSAGHLLTHLWNFSADNTDLQSCSSHNFGESVPAPGSTLLRFWRTLLTHSGYAQKTMVCWGLVRAHTPVCVECGVLNFRHFSSWAGLRREGAPGGLRGRCGRRGDSGTYGDTSERWVRHSVQILTLISTSRW